MWLRRFGQRGASFSAELLVEWCFGVGAHEGPLRPDEGRGAALTAVDLAVGADGADRWQVRRALRLGMFSSREEQVKFSSLQKIDLRIRYLDD